MKNYCYTLIALCFFAFTANAQNDVKLKFNGKGEFKIVQFTDTHVDLASKSNLSVYETIKKVLEIEKPDFAILTGDNVTQNNPQEAYRRFADIFKEANVPWAAVFGNHDSQNNFSREELAEFLHQLPLCMNNDKGETYGNSNFVLPV
ncbi:MAG: metallophosphoesterase, partial [Cyclobacteriaceae bacterium]|nr:metallophosphoesterase [Cyclobacteriaceae bacterium]